MVHTRRRWPLPSLTLFVVVAGLFALAVVSRIFAVILIVVIVGFLVVAFRSLYREQRDRNDRGL
jgi:uncharacterized membrane protein